jgi:hypothetical protein
VTTAVEFQVKKNDSETKRTPDALHQSGSAYSRIDLAGKISITSHRSRNTELEVTRYVLGAADSADHDAKLQKMNGFEDDGFLAAGDYPYWWSWYGWPVWWSHINGTGRITWRLSLEPKEAVELGYEWHYFWQ